MKTETSKPSLFDCVVWAADRPGLHTGNLAALAELFASRPAEETFCLCTEGGVIYGVALAYETDPETVRIGFIATDGSKKAIDEFIQYLNERFPGCKQITFKRRSRDCTVPIDHLPRLLTLKQRL